MPGTTRLSEALPSGRQYFSWKDSSDKLVPKDTGKEAASDVEERCQSRSAPDDDGASRNAGSVLGISIALLMASAEKSCCLCLRERSWKCDLLSNATSLGANHKGCREPQAKVPDPLVQVENRRHGCLLPLFHAHYREATVQSAHLSVDDRRTAESRRRLGQIWDKH